MSYSRDGYIRAKLQDDVRALALEAIRSRDRRSILPPPDVPWLERCRDVCVESRREAFETLIRLADRFFAGEPVRFERERKISRQLRGGEYPDFASLRSEALADEAVERDVYLLIRNRRLNQKRTLQNANEYLNPSYALTWEDYLEDIPFDDSPRPAPPEVTAQEVDDVISVWERAKSLGLAAAENIKLAKVDDAPAAMSLAANRDEFQRRYSARW